MKRLHAVIAMVALILVLSAIACSPGSSEAEQAFNDGMDSYKKGLYTEALLHFSKAIRLDPDYAKAYTLRGVTYSMGDFYYQARQEFDKAIQVDPDFAPAYYNRSHIYRKLGRDAEADADKAKACSLDSQYWYC